MKLNFKATQTVESGKSITTVAPYFGLEMKTGEALFSFDSETLEADCLIKGGLSDEGVTNMKNTIKVLAEADAEARKQLPVAIGTAGCCLTPSFRWWDFLGRDFYQGLIFPFFAFGAVVAAVITASWLLRLIQNCF